MNTRIDSVTSLRGEQTVRTIAATAETLRTALDKVGPPAAGPIVLDCSGVSEVDISFIQLVLAARTTARARGRELRLGAPAQGALLAYRTKGGFLASDTSIGRDRRDFWMNDRTP